MTDNDPWDDPAAVEWARHVMEDMAPRLRGSAMSISLVPDDIGDVKFWVELGASIMMNKPIIAVAFGHEQVPDKLRQVADEIVICPEGVNPSASEELRAAISRVIGAAE